MTKQNQRSGDNSTNFQADSLVVHQGLSFQEVRQVALDVFRANFFELSEKAHKVAAARAEEITEEFLKKLESENPSGFSKSEDPAFQRALFTVQQEYASTGDKDLGALLVDLLVDRSKHEQRDILQIVLNESLNTAPKLTDDQLAVLAIIFLFKYTKQTNIGDHQLLGEFFDKYVLPFVNKLTKSTSCYQHLEFSGCGSVNLGSTMLVNILRIHYKGLFLKGFDADEVTKRGITIGLDSRFFITCLNDSSKTQVNAIDMDTLENKFDLHSIDAEDRNKINDLFNLELMSDGEVIEKCLSIRPYMEEVFTTWASSSMANFSLTSVGIAIGHANIKRLTGEFANLSIWIN